MAKESHAIQRCQTGWVCRFDCDHHAEVDAPAEQKRIDVETATISHRLQTCASGHLATRRGSSIEARQSDIAVGPVPAAAPKAVAALIQLEAEQKIEDRRSVVRDRAGQKQLLLGK